jgi:protein-disulfide isomerase
MKSRFLGLFLPMLMIAGCGSSTDAGTDGTPAKPVAAAAAPAGKSWTDTVSATPEGGFVMGNPNAPLKLIEYGSRLCPFCGNFDKTGFDPMKAKYISTGKLSYEFRDFPIHGAPDMGPILLGHCTGDPTTFFPILDQMYKAQEQLLANEEAVFQKVQAMGNLTPAQNATAYAEQLGYIDFMKQRGLPEAKARACLNDMTAINKIAANVQAATEKYQVQSTPTFILNGSKLDTVDTWEKLEAALKARGA